MAGDLILVLTTSSVPEGEIARALLEDEGIPVLLKGGGEGPYRLGPVHLLVPAELEVQARLVLEEIERGAMSSRGRDEDDAFVESEDP